MLNVWYTRDLHYDIRATSPEPRATTVMLRALFLATLMFVSARGASAQAPSVLHIKIVLLDADRKATPVPRHALLISDNPATAPPRRVVTATDGTADVRLRPGNYTVESDRAGRVPRARPTNGRRSWTSPPAATRCSS